MSTIESRLADAFGGLDIPSTDLVPGVMGKLSGSQARAATGLSVRPFGPILVAAVVFVAVATALIVQPTREVLASWLGIGATRVELVNEEGLQQGDADQAVSETTTTGQPTSTIQDKTNGGTGTPPLALDPIPTLGPPTEMAATAAGGRRFLWPSSSDLPALAGGDLGAILSVRLVDGPLDLKRLAADAEAGHVPILVDGVIRSAVWIGSEHEYVAAGEEPVRSEQVLIWVVDDVQYRLEAELPLTDMVDLAEGVDYGTELLQSG